MIDTVIECPQCHTTIKLTESLAAPLIEATRKGYEAKIAAKDKELAAKEAGFAERESALANAKESLEKDVAERVKKEREKIAAEESQKAKLIAASEIEQKAKENAELQAVLQDRNAKLVEAQKMQADFIRKERELDDAKRELDLTVEKRVQESVQSVREQASKEAEDRLKLQVTEKEQTIASMQKQIEELRRKAEQGSQQLQGEALEVELEGILAAQFPFDSIEPVPKGQFGGDILQRVINEIGGTDCGLILWESKRTKAWSDGWLAKLRDDRRAAGAEVAILVSQVLPKGVESFALDQGIWIVHPRAVLPMAMTLRHLLIEISTARQASQGQQTKMEMIYSYLSGPIFRQRIEATLEAFQTMKEDLETERRVITKQWAKRDKQLERMILSTSGLWGDVQGILGKSLQEIEGLSLAALDAPEGLRAEIEELEESEKQ